MISDVTSNATQNYRKRFHVNAHRVGVVACTYFQNQNVDEVELDNRRALLWQAMEVNYHYTEDWAMVVACAQAGHQAMMRRGYWTQWAELLTLALSAAQHLADPAAIAQLHEWLGTIRHRQGYWRDASEHYRAAVEEYRVIDNHVQPARIWRQLSELLREQGDWAQAEELAHQARAMQMQCGDAVGLAATYSALGHLAFRRNEVEEALQWLQQALAIPELIHDPEAEATVHSRLGNLYAMREEFSEAHRHYEASRLIAAREGDESSLGTALLNQAILYAQQGDIPTSLTLLLQAQHHFSHCGDLQGLALVHLNLSNTYLDLGQFDATIAEGEKAIRLSRQLGDLSSLYQALCNQVEWFYRLDDLARASQLLAEAAAVYQEMAGGAAEQVELCWLQGLLLAAQGDYMGALSQLEQSFAESQRYLEGSQLFYRLGDLVEVSLAAGLGFETLHWVAQARTLAQRYARTDFLGLVEQWAGDTARLQGDTVLAQQHYANARRTLMANDDERHQYLLRCLQERLVKVSSNGNI